MSSPKLSTSVQPAPERSWDERPWEPKTASHTRRSRLQRLLGWCQLTSFGGQLFWLISLSTLAGLGGMAFFFSQMLRDQAEEQVRSSLEGKVNAIAAVTETAETLAYGLGVSATTLHERQAQFPDTYREIVLQLFERRPEFVVGLGLGQSENGIIIDQPWMFPYYSAIISQEDTSFDQDAIRYEDLADDVGEFYPESERYQDYFKPQISTWTDPYQGPNNSTLLTYYLPMFGNEGDWLGTILVDVDNTYLSRLLDDGVFRQAGRFILASQAGAIIADPTGPSRLGTYEDIPGLQALWDRIEPGGSGFLRGGNGYWAYAAVPGQDWLLLGFVPYGAVYQRIAIITVVATAVVMGILTLVLALAIGKLNRRLKPILLQCQQLPKTSTDLLAEWHWYDELDQLSLGFFKILEQLNDNDATILNYQQALHQETSHTHQVVEQLLEFTTRVDNDAKHQQGLLKQAQRLIASKDFQSVDLQLDALSTMGRALDGDLKRLPVNVSSAELFAAVEDGLAKLSISVERTALPNAIHIQAIIARLTTDVAHLKAYDQQQKPSLKKLQYQTSNIVQAGQAALNGSRSMVTVVHSIVETLVKAEAVSSSLNGQAKFMADLISVDLEQRRRNG